MTDNLEQKLLDIRADVDKKLIELEVIGRELSLQQKRIEKTADFLTKEGHKNIDKEQFISFFKKPYVVIPQTKDRVLVAVPKFIKGFQVGWLWKETDSYYIYQFDQYSAWLSDAPKDLLETINFEKNLNIQVEGNTITYNSTSKEDVKLYLRGHLKEVGDTQATILKGHEFDVLAESIEAGCLPFKKRKVAASDIREQKSKIKLRPYQKEAVDKFLETGATGVFHPTGAGKSFITLYLLDIIRGPKLLVVPSRTLLEQWEAYIEQNVPHARSEVRLTTYQGYRPTSDDEYTLTIYDECQRLPADTFSRLAVIRTKYRLGLSASPHREDGREAYIFALTGFPVGLNWQEYMETVGKSYHPIHVHTVRTGDQKMKKLRELLDPKKRTFIFCDTIELGKKVSRDFNIPYIHGDTDNRLMVIEENKVVCVSRVADLGVSVKDLQRIIEIDFLFGSRQQELQRTGRLLHSEEAERHDIIMTESELQLHGKRLWALQEKGFTVKVIN